MGRQSRSGKPKRAISAYFYYLAYCRKAASKLGKNTSDVAKFTKECSAKWRRMNEAQKKPFLKQAAKDKQRYIKQMSRFRGKRVVASCKKRVVASCKPKRPMTGFFIFMGDLRNKMKNKGVENKEIARLAGEKWRVMSAEDKKPFINRSMKAGRKYEQQMVVYRKKAVRQQAAAQRKQRRVVDYDDL